MACGIPAAEFLGICLIMADYDLDMNALEMITRVEEFEKSTGLEYGTGFYDFHSSFRDLLWNTMPDLNMYDIDDALGRTTVRDWVRPMLRFDSVWFNDEGEYWDTCPEDADWPEDKRRLVSWIDELGDVHDRYLRSHLEDRFVVKSSLRFNHSLRELFMEGYPGRHEIVKLFGRSHYARTIPYYWSSRGL